MREAERIADYINGQIDQAEQELMKAEERLRVLQTVKAVIHQIKLAFASESDQQSSR